MPLLDPSDFNAIRAAIDTDLTAEDVPDEIVALAIYQGAGEAEVLRRVPGAADLTGDDAESVKVAAVLFTASLLATGLPRITQEKIGSYSYSLARGSGDLAGIAAALRRRAEAALAPILPDAPARRRFAAGFVVAPAAR